ncbi:unnamed protein product [Citrullus colocynthis]|uniref:HAT C-terminal dimerisation domain-containing protein n=1 Tax=Citrullus colocynthis TaxID=252529 RepID=A0ABP0Z9I6_9ROSI
MSPSPLALTPPPLTSPALPSQQATQLRLPLYNRQHGCCCTYTTMTTTPVPLNVARLRLPLLHLHNNRRQLQSVSDSLLHSSDSPTPDDFGFPYCTYITKIKVRTIENVLRRLFHEYNNGQTSGTCSASVGVAVNASGSCSPSPSSCESTNDPHIRGRNFQTVLDNIMNVDLEDDVQLITEKDYGYTCVFRTAEITSFDRESEIDVYLLESFEECADSSFDILHWWKQNEHGFMDFRAVMDEDKDVDKLEERDFA